MAQAKKDSLTPIGVIGIGVCLFLWGLIFQEPRTQINNCPLYVLQIRGGLALGGFGLLFQAILLMARIRALRNKI